MRRRALLLLTLMTIALMAVASPAWATTFTVNSTADTGDPTPDGTCDICTLREALEEANANNNAPTVDVINFNISGVGPHTISPTVNALPNITEPVTIDGYSQPGSVPNAAAFGTFATLKIVISGASAPTGSNGLGIQFGGSTTVRGLVINGFRESSATGSGGNGIILFNNAGNTNNVIEGNYIGTNAAGNAAVPNEGSGVNVFGASTGNTIGGATPAARNLISGNGEQGVAGLRSGANTVKGNLVGTFQTGAGDLGNGGDGIRVGSSKNIVTDNVVAFNDDNGVEISSTSVGNRILSNSIFSNTALGIDLNPGGREQDPKDPDTGANNLQNFPVITSATTSGTATTIKGTLNSRPRKTYTIQFFSNPIGEDEGKTYLGQVNVKTNRQGKASFNVLGPAVTAGNRITATATNLSTGDTSEFSDPVVVAASS